MEDAFKSGKVKAIGVSNFTVKHLERLKRTATVWPPTVNQIEVHPLYPQTDLIEYCKKEGILVQAYSSLGGQDTGKAFWKKMYKKESKDQMPVTKLYNAPPVVELAEEVQKTPAQVLLRWALENSCAVVPKTAAPTRMTENSQIFDFSLSAASINKLDAQLQEAVERAAECEHEEASSFGRLAWRNDPLRMLDFD
jgi:diketogulonate reductase-like aldo/keto reductase